MHAEYKTQKI